MRLSWIDIVRGICIYCVVLSHTLNVPVLYRNIFEPFFLTTFFFLSGIVFKQNSIKNSLISSTTKILWPYIINSLIAMLGRMKWIELLMAGNITGVAEYFQQWGIRIITGRVFWFLACLFIVQILAAVITYFLNYKKKLIFLTALLCFSYIFVLSGKNIAPWSSNTAILALGYFLVGSICKEKIMSFELDKGKRFWGFIALCVYIALILLQFDPINPTSFDLHTHILSPELSYLFLSFIGITTICLFAISLGKCKFLQILGENSLIIYMYHNYGLLITNTFFGMWHFNCLAQYTYLYPILVSCMSTLITLGIVLFINKYCPILVGKGSCVQRINAKITGN